MTTIPNDNSELRILLSDDTVVELTVCLDKVTAQQVLDQVFCKLRITDYDNSDESADEALPVALWSCGQNLKLQLMPEHTIKDVSDRMKDLFKTIPNEVETSEVVFRLARNGFYDCEDNLIEDITLVKLLYFEAKENVKNNVYPQTCFEFDDMIKLRIINELIEKRSTNQEISNYDQNCLTFPKAAKAIKSDLSYKNSIKKIRIARSVSMHAKRQNSNTDDLQSKSLDDLYREYLRICQTKLDCYGGFIFQGQMERSFIESITHRAYHDKKVSIIINRKGMHIVNKQCPKKVQTFKIPNLGYGALLNQKNKCHSCLYLKDPQNQNKLIEIFTCHAPFIAKTLKTFEKLILDEQSNV